MLKCKAGGEAPLWRVQRGETIFKKSAILCFGHFPLGGYKLIHFFTSPAMFDSLALISYHLAIHFQSLQIFLTFRIHYRLLCLFVVMSLSLREFIYYYYTGISRRSINQNREILLASVV